MLSVAHRFGNDQHLLARAATERVDVVECDVHLSRGRLEVRHHKSLGRLPWLWDRWELMRRPAAPLTLDQVLDALPEGVVPMVDLKGVGRTGAAVAALLAARPARPVIAASRWWRGTLPFVGLPQVTTVLSARGRTERFLLLRRLSRGPLPGGVCLHLSQLSPAVVAALHERVPLVLTWPVEDLTALARAREVGVDGVISKDLALLRQVRSLSG